MKNLKKMSADDFEALPIEERPICRITGQLLTQAEFLSQGRFKCSLYKTLFSKLKDEDQVRSVLQKDYIFCDLNNQHYTDFRACKTGLTRSGYTQNAVEDFYMRVLYQGSKCRFPGCCEKVPFKFSYHGTCSITHYNQNNKIKNGKLSLNELSFVCVLDGKKFKKIESVGNHLRRNYAFTDEQLEAYYREHCLKPGMDSGSCRTCGKPVKFKGIGVGYDAFCHNTDCNVRWHNAHTERLNKSSVGIKKSHSKGDVIPTQIGYWLKRGYNEEQARQLMRERYCNNSVEGIVKRKGCSLDEAIKYRTSITEKWLNNFPKMNWSKVSQKLFWAVYEKIKHQYPDCYFATNNNGEFCGDRNLEYRLKTFSSFVLLDFYCPKTFSIIEFDGTYWHGAKRVQVNDDKRDLKIQEAFPEVRILHVKEEDFLKTPERVIQNCVNFIYDK